jgi:hypothetical protein
MVYIYDLPSDVFFSVFSFLPVSDWFSVMLSCKRFLEEGRRSFDFSFKNNIPLRFACERNHLEVITCLLSNKTVDPAAVRNSPIRIACKKGYLSAVKLLLQDSRVDPSDMNNECIRYAAYNGNVEVVKVNNIYTT